MTTEKSYLSWAEIEERWPGAAAEWDINFQRFHGLWHIEDMYEGAAELPVILVYSDDSQDVGFFIYHVGGWIRL